ncbi:MAG: hypothetical protein EPO67_05725 [Reyranella sp.]|jgi:hypothetical protein|nr:MAG: hypothetical protein EPO67_05725 [Reyranella sp.]
MSQYENSFLRRVLLVDAATCVLAGLVMAVGAKFVNGLTAIPTGLLLPAGLILFPIAAFMAFVATRAQVSRGAVWLIVIGNAGWIVASLYVVLGNAIAPNGLGQIFIGAQALAVALLTLLEYRGVATQPVAA